MNLKDALDMFGATNSTMFNTIKMFYRLKAKEYHPDVVPYLGLPDEECTKRINYWKQLGEAYEIIKKNSPDGKQIMWQSGEYLKNMDAHKRTIDDILNPESRIMREEIKRFFSEFFSDGEKYYDMLSGIKFSDEAILSDPRVSIRNGFEINTSDGIRFRCERPLLHLEQRAWPHDEGNHYFELIEPIRARDRIYGKHYAPMYLTLFLENHGLDQKLGSDIIGKICEDINIIESKAISKDNFVPNKTGVHPKLINELSSLCAKYKLKELSNYPPNPSLAYNERFERENIVFSLLHHVGYRTKAEKNDVGYDITTIDTSDWHGDYEEFFKFTLSEDDMKFIEILMLGNIMLDERFVPYLSKKI
ncbi:MAG: hypothetical protein PHU12_00675 [Candidatus Aenigmarchaeota archaeon]|nr:hypothetical protein [Candidatus Aenigmarchaeota archaeon]